MAIGEILQICLKTFDIVSRTCRDMLKSLVKGVSEVISICKFYSTIMEKWMGGGGLGLKIASNYQFHLSSSLQLVLNLQQLALPDKKAFSRSRQDQCWCRSVKNLDVTYSNNFEIRCTDQSKCWVLFDFI